MEQRVFCMFPAHPSPFPLQPRAPAGITRVAQTLRYLRYLQQMGHVGSAARSKGDAARARSVPRHCQPFNATVNFAQMQRGAAAGRRLESHGRQKEAPSRDSKHLLAIMLHARWL